VFSNRGVRLASFGYFGHMWELYGMWIWIPVMIRASLATHNGDPRLAEFGSFLVIGAGAIGCVVAGLIADRVGRTLVTSWAMAISGTCCLVIGLHFWWQSVGAFDRRGNLGGRQSSLIRRSFPRASQSWEIRSTSARR
jgi:MFS family permease